MPLVEREFEFSLVVESFGSGDDLPGSGVKGHDIMGRIDQGLVLKEATFIRQEGEWDVSSPSILKFLPNVIGGKESRIGSRKAWRASRSPIRRCGRFCQR